eukprot:CCRYP_012500-RB/>CCRYP_012500-RB protein AED:0.06 eAED:0.05 QI:273/0.5/0.33/1/0.5/0.33/3/0/563
MFLARVRVVSSEIVNSPREKFTPHFVHIICPSPAWAQLQKSLPIQQRESGRNRSEQFHSPPPSSTLLAHFCWKRSHDELLPSSLCIPSHDEPHRDLHQNKRLHRFPGQWHHNESNSSKAAVAQILRRVTILFDTRLMHRRQTTFASSCLHHGLPHFRAVVVGSGPSGFYTAKYLMSSVNKRIAADKEAATSFSSSSSSSSWPFSGVDIDILERNNAAGVDDVDNGAISKAKAVVIGNGNVALDCARILAKGRRGLKDTDVPSSVLDVLGDGVEKVVVVGRRGHVQGAFTIKELRELTKLQKEGYDVSFRVRQEELDMGMTQASLQELQLASGRPKMRIDALLREAAAAAEEEEAPKKTIELRLLMNPTRIESINNSNNPRVHHVIFERTQLKGEPGKQLSVGTGTYEEISADLVILSVGYKGSPLEGMNENMFDSQRGIVVNNQGKVCGDNNLFVVGWIKRSPTGIIGSNIMDAKETVASIMKYIDSNPQNLLALNEDSDDDLSKGRRGLIQHLEAKNVKYVTWDQFLQIDQAERDRDRLRSDVQPREKFLSVDEMLACLQST